MSDASIATELELGVPAVSLVRRLTAELIGTALLVAVVVGSGIFAQRLSTDPGLQLLESSIATGAGLVALILAFGPVSGARFNPLVSLLAVLDDELGRRQQVAQWYTRAFNAAGIASTPFVEVHNVSAWAQYTIRVDRRGAVQDRLQRAGIPTAVHYPHCLNKQPAVADPAVSLPIGEDAAEQVLSLPMHPSMTEAMVRRVVDHVVAASSND